MPFSTSIPGPKGDTGAPGNGASTDTYDKLYVTNNGNGTNIKIGDDTWLGDINLANTLSIRGFEDAAEGYISFGSSLAKNIGTDASGKTIIGADLIPLEDNAYVLGNSDHRWKSISIGEGTIYITDASTGQEVALTINNGVFFLDGIAQAQLPSLTLSNLTVTDGNDNVVLRIIEEDGVGKIYFGGGSNGIYQDAGKTYIKGIGYAAESSSIKPLSYNSATGEITYDSAEAHSELVFVSTAPAHDHGKAGDKKYDAYLDNNYLYICKQNYVNDSTKIWYRLDTGNQGNW